MASDRQCLPLRLLDAPRTATAQYRVVQWRYCLGSGGAPGGSDRLAGAQLRPAQVRRQSKSCNGQRAGPRSPDRSRSGCNVWRYTARVSVKESAKMVHSTSHVSSFHFVIQCQQCAAFLPPSTFLRQHPTSPRQQLFSAYTDAPRSPPPPPPTRPAVIQYHLLTHPHLPKPPKIISPPCDCEAPHLSASPFQDLMKTTAQALHYYRPPSTIIHHLRVLLHVSPRIHCTLSERPSRAASLRQHFSRHQPLPLGTSKTQIYFFFLSCIMFSSRKLQCNKSCPKSATVVFYTANK